MRPAGRQTCNADRECRRANGSQDDIRWYSRESRFHVSCPPDPLACDGVPLASIAAEVGTPVYVYSAATIRARYRALDAAFGAYPHALHYALKANSTLAIVRLLRGLGSAADANSIWELELARRAGLRARRPRVHRRRQVDRRARSGRPARPEGDQRRIGRRAGAGRGDRAPRRRRRARRRPRQPGHRREQPPAHLDRPEDQQVRRPAGRGPRARRVVRAPAVAAAGGGARPRRLADHVARSDRARGGAGRRARRRGASRRRPRSSTWTSAAGSACRTTAARCRRPTSTRRRSSTRSGATGLPIVVEPGRTIVAPAGVLVARVIDVKPRTDTSDFVVIDAGMTELLRPALYGAFHRIEPVAPARGRAARSTRSSARSARAATSSAATGRCRRSRSATSSRSATPAPTDPRWRRTTIAVRCRPRCSWTRAAGASIRRRQTLDDMMALELGND